LPLAAEPYAEFTLSETNVLRVTSVEAASLYNTIRVTGMETVGMTSGSKRSLIRWYNVIVNSILNEENNYERHRGNPHRA
jgi:hypothetical protein